MGIFYRVGGQWTEIRITRAGETRQAHASAEKGRGTAKSNF
jgi:hypothetical protein